MAQGQGPYSGAFPPSAYPGQFVHPSYVQQQQAQQQVQKFDQTVHQYVENFYTQKVEVAGISIEMTKNNYNYLHKNYEHFLQKGSAQEKMTLLENTLWKRRSLVNKDSKRYKAIQKKKESQSRQKRQLRCPVYKCFKEVYDDEGLLKHYAESHQDLKALGLDLVVDNAGAKMSAGVKTNVKGKIHNNLLTELLIVSILHKSEVKELLQELNEEVPLNDD